MFMICHFSSLFFIKTKDERLSGFVCLFVFYLLKKWKNYSQHLSFFPFLLLKWNWAIGKSVVGSGNSTFYKSAD